MPSPIAHTLSGCCLVAAAAHRFPEARTLRVATVAVLAANLPDIDLLAAFVSGHRLLGRLHQGLTHSFGFALLAALPLALLLLGRLRFPTAYGLLACAVALHPLLDFFAVDAWPPIGVPLFWPLSGARFHSPVSLFPAVAKSTLSRFFSLHNLRGAAIEAAWFLPLLWLFRRRGTTTEAVANNDTAVDGARR